MDIELAGGAITYEPNADQLANAVLQFAAFDGEVGVGQLPTPDPAAAIDIYDGRGVVVNEIDTVLTQGWIVDQDRQRGPQPAGTAREHAFSVEDANALLDGFRIRASRPSETDYERVIWAAGQYLTRVTVDTTWVLNSNTVTMAKKKYAAAGGFTGELIPDLVEYTGKTMFMHHKQAIGEYCLHWHQLTEGHASGLTISDAAPQTPTNYKPWNPIRRRTAVDLVTDILAEDQAGRTSHIANPTAVARHDVDGRLHHDWQQFEADSQADLVTKAQAYLQSNYNERDTYTCEIGSLDATALALIRVGDLIPCTSSVWGLTASTQRIAHMSLRPTDGNKPGLWNVGLELGAPVRRRKRVRAMPSPQLPAPSYPFVPGNGGSDECSITDDFDRTEAAVWGVSTMGETWVEGTEGPNRTLNTTVDGDFGVYELIGNVGAVVPGGNHMTLPFPETVLEPEWGFDAKFTNTTGSGAGLAWNFFFTLALATDGDIVEFVMVPPGNIRTIRLRPSNNIGVVNLEVGTADSWNTVRHFRFISANDILYYKYWIEGNPEPSTFTAHTRSIGVTDATAESFSVFYGGADDADTFQAFINDLDVEDVNICNDEPPTSGQWVMGELAGTGDASQDNFVTQYDYVPGSTRVYLDGVRMFLGGGYEETGDNDITFDTPPGLGVEIRVEYQAS